MNTLNYGRVTDNINIVVLTFLPVKEGLRCTAQPSSPLPPAQRASKSLLEYLGFIFKMHIKCVSYSTISVFVLIKQTCTPGQRDRPSLTPPVPPSSEGQHLRENPCLSAPGRRGASRRSPCIKTLVSCLLPYCPPTLWISLSPALWRK